MKPTNVFKIHSYINLNVRACLKYNVFSFGYLKTKAKMRKLIIIHSCLYIFPLRNINDILTYNILQCHTNIDQYYCRKYDI